MSLARMIYAVKAVTKPVVANACQGNSAGWFNFVFLFVCIFITYTVHIYKYKKQGSLMLGTADVGLMKSNWNLKLIFFFHGETFSEVQKCDTRIVFPPTKTLSDSIVQKRFPLTHPHTLFFDAIINSNDIILSFFAAQVKDFVAVKIVHPRIQASCVLIVQSVLTPPTASILCTKGSFQDFPNTCLGCH